MSTSLVEARRDSHAYTARFELHPKQHPGFACVTIVLDDSREGDLPIPRFSSSYLTNEEQARKPSIIGMPNLLKECDIHIPPNGGLIVEHGRRMDVLYVFVDDEEGQRDILFQAKERLKKRLDAVIAQLDATYRRANPHIKFYLEKR